MPWIAACPVCRAPLGPFLDDVLTCGSCGFEARRVAGVWRMLHPDRAAEVESFITDYLTVRHAEGRGHADATWYAALPATNPDDPMAEQWRMRRVTWQHVESRFLAPRGTPIGRELDVLDLGAGVGWMSHRLRRLGHRPASVDVNVDPDDGLEATRHLAADWPVVQAHFDHLPFPDASADLCVFNASLHYATEPVATLAEATRVLRPDGVVVVMDSPIYTHERHGAAMLAERAEEFDRRFGTRSDSMPSIGFLTPDRLADWGRQVGIVWSSSTPAYGWRWAVRPLVARVRRQRPPSRFRVLVGRRISAARARS